MFESLTDLVTDASWAYPALFAVALLDAFLPIVPSETMVVAAGVLAASDRLSLGLIVLCAGAGAIVGDHVSYVIGRTLGQRYRHRLFGGKRERQLRWAEHALQTRGPYLIIIARFIPGGRTVTTFAAGLLHYPWTRFTPWDVVAGLIWGAYASLIGYFGGKAFEDEPIKGIILALGIAFAIAGTIELVRFLRKRRGAAERGQPTP
jgi:membrane protein DedA with SNARE-associated domain